MAAKLDEVRDRLDSAERRMNDLFTLVAQHEGWISATPGEARLRLMQEFFFHLVGATELLLLVVNERRNLRLDPERVTTGAVTKALPPTDSIGPLLQALHPETRRPPVGKKNPAPALPKPADWYDDEGYLFRVVNYRNQVAHRHRNPLSHYAHAHLTVTVGLTAPPSAAIDAGSPPATGDHLTNCARAGCPPDQDAVLWLDPRDPARCESSRELPDELRTMLRVVRERCEQVLAQL
jgi:hypothetical protein